MIALTDFNRKQGRRDRLSDRLMGSSAGSFGNRRSTMCPPLIYYDWLDFKLKSLKATGLQNGKGRRQRRRRRHVTRAKAHQIIDFLLIFSFIYLSKRTNITDNDPN